jgi:hypothetical protein
LNFAPDRVADDVALHATPSTPTLYPPDFKEFFQVALVAGWHLN